IQIVDRRNVRMVQRCENLGLSLESIETIGITREFFGKDLDRDLSFQFRVFCAVDFAHPALAEQRGNLVRAELCADGEGQTTPAFWGRKNPSQDHRRTTVYVSVFPYPASVSNSFTPVSEHELQRELDLS